MTKQKTQNRAALKLLLILPVITSLALIFSCSRSQDTEEQVEKSIDEIVVTTMAKDSAPEMEATEKPKQVYKVVEEMPEFEGGDIDKFRNWVMTNVKYPEIAKENGIQGAVHCQFVVDEEGNVTDVEIAGSVDPSLDNEVIRVVKSSPKWTPGRQTDKPVAVKFDVTVKFVMQ